MHFKKIKVLPPDSILGLQAEFAQDPRKEKINLSIGVYKDDLGKTPVLECVREAEKLIFNENREKNYLPIDGDPQFILKNFELILGSHQSFPHELIGFQAIGGSGALRIGLDFLMKNGFRTLYVSNLTWPNHRQIAQYLGMTVHEYAYYDERNKTLDFEGMKKSIQGMSQHDVLLLQACCHNPTGADLEPDQWRELSKLIKEKGVFVFFDLAYQGFGDSLEEDVFPIRYFANEGHEMFVANSFAKNMGLYGERAGLLLGLVHEKEKKGIFSQINYSIRSTYSTPPMHPARIVAKVLENSMLKKKWEEELTNMRARMQELRKRFAVSLSSLGLTVLGNSLLNCKGMFSQLGLTPNQVEELKMKHAIYLSGKGRVNIAALNQNNIDIVASGIASTLR